MALFIDKTYFAKEPLKIDGIDSSNGYSSNITNKSLLEFNDAIDEFEAEYLQLLFGEDLYEEFIEDYELSKWDALKALLYNDTTKKSPIANYIYKRYIHRKFVVSVADKSYNLKASDNLIQVPPVERIKNAWRPSIRLTQKIMDYLYENFESLDTENELDTSNWELLIEPENCFF